jgi:hypothetical protein
MIDNFVLLAPLILLPVVVLFVFVGCARGEVPPSMPPVALTLSCDSMLVSMVQLQSIRVEFTTIPPLPAPPRVFGLTEAPVTTGRLRHVYSGLDMSLQGTWSVTCKAWYTRQRMAEVQAQPTSGLVRMMEVRASESPITVGFFFSLTLDPMDSTHTRLIVSV